MSMDWKIEKHAVLGSTQDLLQLYAGEGKAEGLVVQASEQTQGRGRHGRVWHAGTGNLYLSVLLRPGCVAEKIGQISICAGVAVAKTVEAYTHTIALPMLKWPNDVLLRGKKCAGILPETSLFADGRVEWLALGVGVNTCDAPPDVGAAVQRFSGDKVTPDGFRDKFLFFLAAYYKRWQEEGFEEIRKDWLSLGHKKGERILVKPGDKIVSGYFETINNDGSLLLRDEDGASETIMSGDVFCARDG